MSPESATTPPLILASSSRYRRELLQRLGLVFDGAYTRYLKQPFRRGGLANRVPGGTFTPEEHV